MSDKKKYYMAIGNDEYPAVGGVFGVYSTEDAAWSSARNAMLTGREKVVELYLDEDIDWDSEANK